MIDATRLLDLLVGGGSQQDGPFNAPQPYARQAQQGQLDQQSGGGDLLERAKGLLQGSGFGGGVAGGVAAGAVTSLLLGSKGGRELAGEALKLGAAAALGGIAYKAYANYRDGKPVGAGFGFGGTGATASGGAVPSTAPSPLPPVTPANEHAKLLVRAMIAAALSDGTLDASEREHIVGRLAAAGMDQEAVRFLDAEIARPWSPAQFAAAAPGPEQRSEVYLASMLAIDADTEAERAYLRYLAATLGLDDKLVAHLEAAVQGAKAGADGPPRQLGTEAELGQR
jgi:uncharacterized membrane protein YebE (DUF533 family)